ncbi:MAG TPA: carboxypeptidase-like regulatory domain-containing protein, partial [Cyclobacteriaceae bacterium]
MQFKLSRFSFFLLALLLSHIAAAQTYQITGRVLDSGTLEPLPFANVFVPNTTIGTATNAKGEFVLKNIQPGSQEIIFSFVGYHSYQTRVFIKETDNAPLVIKLLLSEQNLQEVQVVTSRDKIWEKQLKRFERVFIGEGEWAKECKIKNPWVLDFVDKGNELTAKGSRPLEIENLGLGYRVFYNLTDFTFTGNSYSIIGDVRFVQMTPRNALEAVKWGKNRELVYLSSTRHLMKSILNKRINGEGFQLYAEKTKGKARTNNFAYELANNVIPYDTSSLVSKGINPGEYRILFREKVEIHNTNEISKSGFYRDISYGLSWIETSTGYVRINKEGAILNPKELIISGDMSLGRVAMMLPLDYVKGKLVTLPTNEALSAKRLQEKVFISTDKPYYYPDETVWLSAFVNYRAQSASDTLSKVLYVDLMDENRSVVHSSILKIDSGRAIGNFRIDQKIKPGDYVLRVYTQWMRNYGIDNFFFKRIPIIDLYDKVITEASHRNDSNNLKLELDKASYKKRDKVTVKFHLDDGLDSLVRASLNVSVTDLLQVSPINEEPAITQNYLIDESLPERILQKFVHPIEKGIKMSGTYLNKKGKPESAKITVVKENWEDIYQVSSDKNGVFSISDLVFFDSLRFGIQTDGGSVVLNEKEKPIGLGKLPDYKYKITKSS